MAQWLMSLRAMKTKCKNPLLTRWTSIQTQQLPPPCALLHSEQAFHSVPAAQLSTSPSNWELGWGCGGPAPPEEAAHSGGCRGSWKPSLPAGVQSGFICSGQVLKAVTCCHRCFRGVGTSVPPGNVRGRGGESVWTQKVGLNLTLEILVCRSLSSGVFSLREVGGSSCAQWCWMAQSGTLGMRKNMGFLIAFISPTPNLHVQLLSAHADQ